LGFGTFKVSLDTEQCYLKLSDLEKVKHEEKMPLADHRSALIRVIEILSVIEGLRFARGDSRLGSLNQEIVKTLNAQVILVASDLSSDTRHPTTPQSGSVACRRDGAQARKDGEMELRRVKRKHLVSRTVPNNLHTLMPGAILIVNRVEHY
jgi:hypothetical protein